MQQDGIVPLNKNGKVAEMKSLLVGGVA